MLSGTVFFFFLNNNTKSFEIYKPILLKGIFMIFVMIKIDMQMTPPLWQKVKRN